MHRPLVDGKGVGPEVEVTTRNINKALKACSLIDPELTNLQKAKQRARNCAIAQAIKKLPGVIEAVIGVRTAKLTYADRIERWGIHPDDIKKTRAFDKAEWFQPGKIRLVEHPKPLGSRAGQKSGSNKREGKANSIHNREVLRHA